MSDNTNVISRGQDMNTVKEILERHNVIRDMKTALMEQEDMLVRDTDIDPSVLAAKQLRIAITRNNLNDLISTIISYVTEGEIEIEYQS